MADFVSCPFEPASGYVAIRPAAAPGKTAGGILLPGEYRGGRGKRKERERDPRAGVVAAIGPGRRMKDGSYVPPLVKVGDKVVYLTYTDTAEWVEGGWKWHIVEEDDLLMVVEQVEEVVAFRVK